MTAPVSSTYSASSGNVIYGGRSAPAAPAQTGDPAWLPAEGTFVNLGASTLNSVKPAGWPNGDAGGPFNLWSGGVWSKDFSSRGAYTIHGSGHGSQNEAGWGGVWHFDLDDLTWKGSNVPPEPLLEDYTGQYYNIYGEYQKAGTTAAGHTYVPHTYDGLVYQPAANGGGTKGSLIRCSLAGSNYQRAVHQFDVSMASAPAVRRIDSLVVTDSYPCAAADPAHNCFWYIGGSGAGPLMKISFGDFSYTLYPGKDFGSYGNQNMMYIPAPYDCLLAVGTVGSYPDLTMAVHVCPFVGGEPQGWTRVTTTGTPPADTRAGGVWSTLLNQVVSYNATGSYVVHKLAPPASGSLTTGTWVWTTETLVGVNGAVPSRGTYDNGSWSRFIEVPNARCFIWCDSINHLPQAWRLTGM
jgi:hypothetical protein